MTRSRLAGSALVLITCGALAACASGHPDRTQTSSTTSDASSVSAGVPVPGGANVHLTDHTDDDSRTSSVILSGAVGDYGSAKRDDGHGQLDLELSRGTLRIDISDLQQQFLARLRNLTVNQHGCSAEAGAAGAAPIVARSGTGAYSTVSGTFDLTMTLDEIYHPGACRENAPYLAQKIIMTGWGTLSLG